MKILYIAEARLPNQRANSIHVMRMCRSMAVLGHQVKLLAFKHSTFRNKADVYKYYGVDPIFDIKLIKSPGTGRLSSFWLGLMSWFEVLRTRPGLVYSRSLIAAYLAPAKRGNLVFESHSFLLRLVYKWQKTFFRSILAKKSLNGVVVISDALKQLYVDSGIQPDVFFVAHDGADECSLKETAQLQGDYPVNVGYFGSIYNGRGIEKIIAMALARPKVGFHLFGAHESDMGHFDKIPHNFHFYGFITPSQVYKYRNSCDILLAPYQKEVFVSTKQTYSTSLYMSPLKIFEYMSSGKAIMVSDMPVLREIFDDQNAVLVPPEDEKAWIAGLDKLVDDEAFRESIGRNALKKFLEHYTWDIRAKRILSWIENRSNK